MQQSLNAFLSNTQRGLLTKAGLFYGNPLKHQVEVMVKPNDTCLAIINSGVLNKYYSMPYQNISDMTGVSSKKELNEMLKIQSTVTEDQLKFIEKCEVDVAEVWVDALKELDIPKINKKQLDELMAVSDGILYSLKYYYQRPRPFQLAYISNVKLYPLVATNACSPSYPGGHAFDAYKIAFILGKRYPEKSPKLMQIAESITFTRVQGGLHYPSDSIISKMMARELVDQGFFDNFLVDSK